MKEDLVVGPSAMVVAAKDEAVMEWAVGGEDGRTQETGAHSLGGETA